MNVVFQNLTREQITALLALTKNLGHDRLVTKAETEEAVINAYKTGFFDSAAMFSMSDANVKEEMEIGLKDHLEFLQSLSGAWK